MLDCDFLTISGHKMLGPTASGGLYAKRELLEAMDPFMGGGEMIREVGLDTSTWREIPWKFEAGTMNIAEEIGLAAAIDYLEPIGMDAVRAHEEDVAQYAHRPARSRPAHGVRPARHERARRRGVVLVQGHPPARPAQVLEQEGVAIRAGHHCTQIAACGVLGTPATARASFYLYNTQDEVDVLIAALAKAEDAVRAVGRRRHGRSVSLDDIYKEVILDHYKNPRNKRELPEAELRARGTTRCAATRSPCSRTWRTARWRTSRSRAGVLDLAVERLDDDRGRQGQAGRRTRCSWRPTSAA